MQSATLSDRSSAERLLQKFEEKGNHAAALHIAVETGDAERIKRLLVEIIQYGIIDATRVDMVHMTESLLKAVPYYHELGKRIVRLIDNQRESTNLFPQSMRTIPELEYFFSAGKIAAVIGEVKDARRAVARFLYEEDFLRVAEIAALMEEEKLTEQAVSKYLEVTKDDEKSSQLGYIIATTANHHHTFRTPLEPLDSILFIL